MRSVVAFSCKPGMSSKMIEAIGTRISGFVAGVLSVSGQEINRTDIVVREVDWTNLRTIMSFYSEMIVDHSLDLLQEIDFAVLIRVQASAEQLVGFNNKAGKIAFFLRGAMQEADPETEMPQGIVHLGFSNISVAEIS